jgi:hypothetical protein
MRGRLFLHDNRKVQLVRKLLIEVVQVEFLHGLLLAAAESQTAFISQPDRYRATMEIAGFIVGRCFIEIFLLAADNK